MAEYNVSLTYEGTQHYRVEASSEAEAERKAAELHRRYGKGAIVNTYIYTVWIPPPKDMICLNCYFFGSAREHFKPSAGGAVCPDCGVYGTALESLRNTETLPELLQDLGRLACRNIGESIARTLGLDNPYTDD